MNNDQNILRRLVAAFATVAFAVAAPDLSAKAYFATDAEMIERAEIIAIVDISHVEAVETKSSPFDYSEIAHASVQQVYKGTLARTAKFYGGESFVCAQVRFAPGRYLVFLRRDENHLLAGCNWHLSVRPIKGAEVEWYTPGERLKLSWQPLDTVRERIKNPPTEPAHK